MPTAEITNTTTLIAPAMRDGELRILDTDLATRLGFDRPRDIRKLIKRYEAELGKMGVCATVALTSGEAGGRPGKAYYLNKKQAIFITAKSETAEATEITIEIIEKFDAYERGETTTPQIAVPKTMTEALRLAAELSEKNDILLNTVAIRQRELAEAAPKVAALDRISTADGSYGLTEAAKILQVKPKALIAFMATSQWIYRRNNAKNWLAYQAKIDAGYLWHKIATYTDPNGEEKTRDTVKVLPKGLAKLAQIVPGAKIDPNLMQIETRLTVKRASEVLEYVPLDTTERQQERLTTKASFITTDMILMTAMDRWEAMRWSGAPQSQEDADMWYEINDYTPKTPYAHKRKERFLGLFPHTAIKRSTIPA
ncbi:MAG: phage antirepressor KilAC domain-containing protein [Gluconobacter sp.]|uniref:phage antirepressor KilAC domain-containing protein n=1 Tax=Gluconobacter sp. TaxID=1876758 RepID=UPI0039ED19E4